MFSESLTIRILADSSAFRTELDAVLGQLESFQERVTAIADAGRSLSEGVASLAKALGPVQQLSKLLTGIQQQIRSLSRTPVTLNVQPALAALHRLAAAIDAIAARLRALSLPSPSVIPATLPNGLPGRATKGSIPAAAGAISALVTPPSIASRFSSQDTLPAMLNPPAIDLSLRSNADRPSPERVQQIPVTQNLPVVQDRTLPGQPAAAVTTNHFGGITIQVRETADVNALVRDLRLQGIHLRNRRG